MSKVILSSMVAALSISLATAAMATNPAGRPGTANPGQPADQERAEMREYPDVRDNRPTAPKISEAELRAAMQIQGYTHILKAELKGLEYEVDALKEGRPVKALVDATTGEVKSEIQG
jgi:hypothetical protein